jgi:hypothetical protein
MLREGWLPGSVFIAGYFLAVLFLTASPGVVQKPFFVQSVMALSFANSGGPASSFGMGTTYEVRQMNPRSWVVTTTPGMQGVVGPQFGFVFEMPWNPQLGRPAPLAGSVWPVSYYRHALYTTFNYPLLVAPLLGVFVFLIYLGSKTYGQSSSELLNVTYGSTTIFFIGMFIAGWALKEDIRIMEEFGDVARSRMAAGGILPFFHFREFVFYTIVSLIAFPGFLAWHGLFVFVVLKYAYGVLQQLHFWFVPHPVAQIVQNATRPSRAVPTDGRRFVALIERLPGSGIAERNRRRHAEELTRQARQEAERLRAEAELTQAMVEVERARARLDAMGKGKR